MTSSSLIPYNEKILIEAADLFEDEVHHLLEDYMKKIADSIKESISSDPTDLVKITKIENEIYYLKIINKKRQE